MGLGNFIEKVFLGAEKAEALGAARKVAKETVASGEALFSFQKTQAGRIGSVVEEGGLKSILAMGLVGGGVSALTGGSFWMGAGAGAIGGHLAGKGQMHLEKNAGSIREAMRGVLEKTEGKGFRSFAYGALINQAPSINAIQRRHAMLGGAGLSGLMFPSAENKPNHRRGFNAHRGNTF